MPTKRFHRKSRGGCDACKQRRVKCDEATPTCGTCALRREACHYSQPTDKSRVSKRLPEPSSSESAPPASRALQERCCTPDMTFASWNAIRMKEMRLMHQWTTQTYLISGGRNLVGLRDYLVRESLQCPFLMDVLLAFTSLHSASKTQSPTDAREHVTTALHYQNQSLAQMYRTRALENISRDTFDWVVSAAGLNMVCALLGPLMPAAPGKHMESMVTLLLRVRKHHQGLFWLVLSHQDWATSGALTALDEGSNVRPLENRTGFTEEKLHSLSDSLRAHLDSENSPSPTCYTAIEAIGTSYIEAHGRSVFSWLGKVDEDFFRALEEAEVAALVISMCWATIMFSLEDAWWTKYVGRKIVEDSFSKVEGCDSKWDDLVQWCCTQVGVSEKRLFYLEE